MRRGSGKRGERARAQMRKPLDDVIAAADAQNKTRPAIVQKNVEAFFEHKKDDKKNAWETEGKGIGPDGEFLTLEDLIYLKPFTMEDMNSTVAFRTNDKMMRSFQRLKEASGGVYDIMSDLYRDAAAIGLMVISERHKSILGLEIVISRAERHQQTTAEARDMVLRLRETLRPLEEGMKKTYFGLYMESLEERPRWYQELHLEEIKRDSMLKGLLEEMGGTEEESN